MCGIVAVAGRRSERPASAPDAVVALLDSALAHAVDGAARLDAATLALAAAHLEDADALLRGVPGLEALLAHTGLAGSVSERVERTGRAIDSLEQALDVEGLDAAATTGGRTTETTETAEGPEAVEVLNAALVRIRDAAWALSHDRLGGASRVAALAGDAPGRSAIEVFRFVEIALGALDRLEVRGRDSAGISVLVHDPAFDPADPVDPGVAAEIAARCADGRLRSGAVRTGPGWIGFTYKAAAEIGELGDNVRELRRAVASDALLRRALAGDAPTATVLGHTRWASIGVISEVNAHPLDELRTGAGERGTAAPGSDPGAAVFAALNGDVDNHAEVAAVERLEISPEFTTDAKVIPAVVSRRRRAGLDPAEAFRDAVASFEGSVAIAAQQGDEPGRIHLAVRGSGQALYVGLADDTFVVASEPYGLVEETSRYLRIDGETPADPSDPSSSRGQVVTVDGRLAGLVEGIGRYAYDGTPLPVAESEIVAAEMTTRDVERGDSPHFLVKEIGESPASLRKTLRGKIAESGGRLTVALGPATLPAAVREALRDGRTRRVLAVGQGSAAVAAQSLAAAFDAVTAGRASARPHVEALPATELSGFRLTGDMSDTLVVAISQSGTTTDTNRTVEMARSRGAAVVAVVNRRGSDLVDRSDGVLYTSDGRDVEMSVASTKAFYAQVAAGFLLAAELASEAGVADPDAVHDVLDGLRRLPDAMGSVVRAREQIAPIARRHAPLRRSWAVVGNGANRIAAAEVRIKLSELCYKAIACDATEDKKHIDLSSEPLVLVCAAGLTGSNADDVAKELAIYRAHKAAVVAIVSDGDDRFDHAADTIRVPSVHAALDFVLATVAGHVFGYEAALAIDESAFPLREARGVVERAALVPTATAGPTSGDGAPAHALFDELSGELAEPAGRFFARLRAGGYDGCLDAATAVRIASAFLYATGTVPLDAYQVEHGAVGTPATVLEELDAALARGIDELTRPIDAIKHQAKTVTVGISRADDTFLRVPLVREVLGAGAARDTLSYRSLRALVALDRAVGKVAGFTRYRVEGDPAGDGATVAVVDRGGLGATLRSRTESDPRLRGTKALVASEREVTVARGRSDQRTVVIVPEVKGVQTVGLTLLHVEFADRLAPAAARAVLEGYRHRYAALKGAVTETEPEFDDSVLGRVPVADLLTEPVYVLAERWRPGATP